MHPSFCPRSFKIVPFYHSPCLLCRRYLKVLVRNPQIVLTRQVLLEKLWDADENFVDEHALTVAISRIRGKIETDGLQYIKTVYGMGYMWIGGIKK